VRRAKGRLTKHDRRRPVGCHDLRACQGTHPPCPAAGFEALDTPGLADGSPSVSTAEPAGSRRRVFSNLAER
jgi:hypothetical protein